MLRYDPLDPLDDYLYEEEEEEVLWNLKDTWEWWLRTRRLVKTIRKGKNFDKKNLAMDLTMNKNNT